MKNTYVIANQMKIPAPGRRAKKRISRATRRKLLFFVLIAPAILLRILTAVYPVLQTIYLSFFEINFISGVERFVGLNNFRTLLRSLDLKDIMEYSAIFILGSTALELVIGMAVASLLNAKIRARRLVRTVNLVPWAIPTIVAGLMFRWMLDDQYGMITDIIFRLLGTRTEILVYPVSARIATVLVNVWKNTPFMAVVLLAGLQSVPEELYEAARIDGASPFKSFWYITVPVSLPIIITLGMFFLIWQLSSFDLIYGMTHGGPGLATTPLSYRIFQTGMLWYNWGMASALSMVLLLVVVVFGLVGLWLFRRYEITL